jgi:anti-anti-sigma regulatory factor
MTLQTLPAASGWRLFKIEGQLDFAGAPTVQTALCCISAREASNLLIDLEDVNTADDKGVATLVGTVRRLLSDNPQMHVAFVARQPWLAEVLTHAGYPSDVPVFHDGLEALRIIETGRPARAA